MDLWAEGALEKGSVVSPKGSQSVANASQQPTLCSLHSFAAAAAGAHQLRVTTRGGGNASLESVSGAQRLRVRMHRGGRFVEIASATLSVRLLVRETKKQTK